MNQQVNQVILENIEQPSEPPKQFTFDAVYAEDSITENLYAESVFSLVENVNFWKTKKNNNSNNKLFVYSGTWRLQCHCICVRSNRVFTCHFNFPKCKKDSFPSCGKSFTMQGINTPGSLQRGVIPRSFEVESNSFVFIFTIETLSLAYLRCIISC